ncbi:MAG TPA: VOC family protein [Tepidisphaeraceae bacterium]|jgi:catechol 2,3-dioxygenase-like lactoylglutathione lyase family enzyme
MLRKVDRILLRVPSLAAGVGYYRDVLGMKLAHQSANHAAFSLGEAELLLHAQDDWPDEATYFLVDDVKALYEQREKLKLHFLSPPAPASRGWRASVKDPFGNVLLLLDQTTAQSAAAEIPAPPGSLFAGVETKTSIARERLAAIYATIGRTADDLPYTPHFESLYNSYIADMAEPKPSKSEVWRHILNLRKKKGGLPKLGAAKSHPPEITDEQRQLLLRLLGDNLGRRDRLPYTDQFDKLVDRFNKGSPRPISPHLVWRLVATLAK